MNISFENKVALVTGAASGLGLATAKAFAESGAAVALADWNEEAVQVAAKELADKGHKTLAIRCDVSDDAQVELMVKQTVAAFGRLDAAYNNAGVQNVLAETADTTGEDYDRVMSINLRGVWNSMKFELQQMRQQGERAIVNCSSLGGLVGGAERGIYHAAKHGVIGFTKSAALEYAPRGIRVNAVCPGLIWTPMAEQMVAGGQGEALKAMEKSVPMARMGKPEEIADAVCGFAVRPRAMSPGNPSPSMAASLCANHWRSWRMNGTRRDLIIAALWAAGPAFTEERQKGGKKKHEQRRNWRGFTGTGHYTKDALMHGLWKRAELSPRDRSIVTVAALIARMQSNEMPHYFAMALDKGVKPGELSKSLLTWPSTPARRMRWQPYPWLK